ncbi:IS3 family transposase [Streptomyces sp. NPDC051657]|uniref:IS3 family transposase n=1 Tax=unclassified Streptomyces TaxID=2593676 RepID=UPI00341E813E
MKVSRTAFSARRSGLPGPRAVRDAELTKHITQVHARSRGTYGAPRVHAVLMREGAGCGRRCVARLMRAVGLQGRHRRRRHVTTTPIPGLPSVPASSSATSSPTAPRSMPAGAATSHMSRQRRAGHIWPRSSTSPPGA